MCDWSFMLTASLSTSFTGITEFTISRQYICKCRNIFNKYYIRHSYFDPVPGVDTPEQFVSQGMQEITFIEP